MDESLEEDRRRWERWDMSRAANRLRTLGDRGDRDRRGRSDVDDIVAAGLYRVEDADGPVLTCFACHADFSPKEARARRGKPTIVEIHRRRSPECPSAKARASLGDEESSEYDMSRARNRLATLRSWPKGGVVSPESLAAAGLYFVGRLVDDAVRCFACHVTFGDWEPDDDAAHAHRMMSPLCPFAATLELNPWRTFDMRVESNRLRSLRRMSGASVDRRALARSGFYYLGDGRDDRVDCFACHASADEWRADDAPDEVHPRCPHLADPDYAASLPNVTVRAGRLATFAAASPTIAESTRRALADSGLYAVELRLDGRAVRAAKCFACDALIGKVDRATDVHSVHRRCRPACPYVAWRDRRATAGPSTQRPRKRYDPSSDWRAVDPLCPRSRERTFDEWPVAFLAPAAMAASGLYYAGAADTVRCFSCGASLACWRLGDSPEERHRERSPRCAFLASPRRRDFAYAPDAADMGAALRRLASFEDAWPPQIEQRPKELAAAGFYYARLSDGVACYYCGLSLCSWLPGDDPWTEHARHRPLCDYVRLMKGDEFVEAARKQPRAENWASDVADPISDEESATATSDEGGQCRVCLRYEAQVLFGPCGHVACARCSLTLENCPICRETIATANWIR